MKRLLFLFVLLTLMAACSLPEAAQDTTAGIRQEMIKDGVEVPVNDVSCWGVFPSRNFGVVMFNYEVAEDSLKMGWEEPYDLYGTAFLLPMDEGFLLEVDRFSCNDSDWKANMLGGQEGEPIIFLEGPVENEFFTNLLEVRVPYPLVENEKGDAFLLEVSGVAMNPDHSEFLSWLKPENAKEELLEFDCYGQLIPGSATFNIIIIGAGQVGQQILMAGVAEQEGLKPVSEITPFECDGSGQIVINHEEQFGFILQNVGLKLGEKGGDGFIIKSAPGTGTSVILPDGTEM